MQRDYLRMYLLKSSVLWVKILENKSLTSSVIFILFLKLFNLKILTQRTYNRHFTSWLSLCVGCKMVCGDCNKCVNQIVIKRTAPYYMWSNINSLLERKGGCSSRVRFMKAQTRLFERKALETWLNIQNPNKLYNSALKWKFFLGPIFHA